ncbi:unnamed protein product [Protopolystoma xenopodis]|uniref:Uncharacterized protein n=1 Tax=Protopolystoma xenopodis TaxID=117903 RepID=A0A448WKX4_9PLAT|nr:unnamed protein product [Protopolystoma xenopodis]
MLGGTFQKRRFKGPEHARMSLGSQRKARYSAQSNGLGHKPTCRHFAKNRFKPNNIPSDAVSADEVSQPDDTGADLTLPSDILVSDPSSANNLEEAKVLASSSVMLVAGIAVGETKKPQHNHPIVGGSPAKIVDKLSQKAEKFHSTTESGKKNIEFKHVSGLNHPSELPDRSSPFVTISSICDSVH